MFGLGLQEIVVLLLFVGAAVVAVVAILAFSGRGRRMSTLEAENRLLRDENERLRDRG